MSASGAKMHALLPRAGEQECHHQLPVQNFTVVFSSSSFWLEDQLSHRYHLCLGLVTQIPVSVSPSPPFSTPTFLYFHRNRCIFPGAGSVFVWVKSGSLMSWLIKGSGNPITPRSLTLTFVLGTGSLPVVYHKPLNFFLSASMVRNVESRMLFNNFLS